VRFAYLYAAFRCYITYSRSFISWAAVGLRGYEVQLMKAVCTGLVCFGVKISLIDMKVFK